MVDSGVLNDSFPKNISYPKISQYIALLTVSQYIVLTLHSSNQHMSHVGPQNQS